MNNTSFTAEQVANILLKAEKDFNFKGVFFIKRKNEEAIFFSKKENTSLIVCFNSHFTTTFSKDIFLNNFLNEKFYFYESNEDNDDEKIDDRYYRQ